MSKFFMAAVVLLASLFSTPSFADSYKPRDPLPVSQCSVHTPFGVPQTTAKLQLICRQAYLVGYDAANKVPEYVEWTLTPQAALGCVARSNAFVADPSIPNGSTPGDYAGTGYDKGHMAPDGDQSWNQQVEWESFLMTNMTPQAPALNRGIWKLLETSFRGWTVQNNRPFTAISGAVYSTGDKTIGKGVIVPHAFFKVVIDDQTGMVAGWWFPHVAPYPNMGTDLTKFRMPIATIQKQAGITIPLPKNAQELAVGKEWAVDFGALTNAKRAKCGKGASAEDSDN
jgi:endonuclease G, mitochondrial